MPGALTEEQLDHYRRRGYAIVREAIDPGSLGRLTDAADAFADQARTLTGSTAVLELDDVAGAAVGHGLIRRIKSPHFHHKAFARSLAQPALLDIVQQLLGPDIRWHHTKLNAKQPKGSGHVEWHTDWGYYPHTNADLLEVAIAIDPTTEANGCLWVLPGSHLGPALDHTEDGRFVGAVPPGSFDRSQIEALELEPGDISLHHVRLLHGSGPNRTDQQRRLLLQGYAAADAWPLMAQHQPNDWPEWDRRILRGRPTTEARLDQSPVKVPLPATAALGLFETQQQLSVSHFDGADRGDQGELGALVDDVG
ncbi:MAG: phytanoyl-CoA dioxygenase family protein [Acidimicrobiales bacterium]